MSDKIEVSVRVNQQGQTASKGHAGDHQVVMDRPQSKGGENQGPMGGQVLLMALGGCFMSNLLAAAKARDTELSDVVLEITGTLGAAPARFEAVQMRVHLQDQHPENLEKIMTIAERGCIVANTLKGSVDLSISMA